MSLEDTKLVGEAVSVRELNLFLLAGWKLLLTYVEHTGDKQEPRFVIGWQNDEEPVIPELLDKWEIDEIKQQTGR